MTTAPQQLHEPPINLGSTCHHRPRPLVICRQWPSNGSNKLFSTTNWSPSMCDSWRVLRGVGPWCASAWALAEHGLTFLDRFGSPHARPEVAIARDATIAVARLCRELDLDADAICRRGRRHYPAIGQSKWQSNAGNLNARHRSPKPNGLGW